MHYKDDKRIPKNLYTSHPQGPAPTLYRAQDEWEEAKFLAREIKRLMAHGGEKLTFNDFAVLRESFFMRLLIQRRG
jgi:DNA helicase-2/ATP-dependent DNA helicase PcrA